MEKSGSLHRKGQLGTTILGGIIGVLIGAITGLLPGIHINLVSTTLLTYGKDFPFTANEALVGGIIIAVAIVHTLIDFIPTTYIGAPTEETALSTFPAHELLKEGRGHEAVLCAFLGAAAGLMLAIGLFLIEIKSANFIDRKIGIIIPFILAGISIYMILREKHPLKGFLVWTLAGFLGYGALNIPMKEPLFPLLTGLFGLSGLVLSTTQSEKIPSQTIVPIKKIALSKRESLKNIVTGTIIAIPCAALPALGSGYAATITAEITEPSARGFLFLSGMTNMLTMTLSFILVYTLGKARTGAAAGLKQVIPEPSTAQWITFGAVAIMAIVMGLVIGIYLSKKSSTWITKISYSKLSKIIFIGVVGMIVLLSGAMGIIVAATGCAIGVYAATNGVKRLHMMGCLVIPTLLYYLF